MKTTTKAPSPQGLIQKTRSRNVAHISHSPGPVRQRTIPQNDLCSIRRLGGYESNETHTTRLNPLPANVTEADGRNDKIHIVCSIAAVLCETMDDARSFVLHCGAAPSQQRNEHEFFSELFTTASKNGDGNLLDVRSLPMDCGGQVIRPPLFSGQLRFRRLTRSDGKIAVIVTADLNLNVNRALNHKRAELVNGGYHSIFASAGLIKRGLCGGDNLAPFDLEQGEHDNARRAYLQATMAAILADVKRAAKCSEEAGSGLVQVTGHPCDFSLREVETCWDIGGGGFYAVKALADITPVLYEYGGKRGWVGNAGTVTIQFSSSERLVVYAKAPDRLRFEIRHRPPQGNRPYSSATIAETTAKLDGLRKSAAVRINDVLSFVGSRPTASRDVWEWEAFAMAWGACCGTTEAAKALYRILRQNGRIQGGKCVECIVDGDKLLRKARDAKLIQISHGAFRPIFSHDPRPALTDLYNAASFPLHKTDTQPVCVSRKSPTPIRKGREAKGIPPSPPVKLPPSGGGSGN